jgi:predicted site-specific integrase-resolvase
MGQTQEQAKLYNAREAAEYLNMSWAMLRKYVYDYGTLTPDDRGPRASLLFKQETLDKFRRIPRTGARDTGDVSEIAERYNVTRAAVCAWCREGRFPNAYKDESGEWIVPSSDLEGFVPPHLRGQEG